MTGLSGQNLSYSMLRQICTDAHQCKFGMHWCASVHIWHALMRALVRISANLACTDACINAHQYASMRALMRISAHLACISANLACIGARIDAHQWQCCCLSPWKNCSCLALPFLKHSFLHNYRVFLFTIFFQDTPRYCLSCCYFLVFLACLDGP